MKKKLIVIFTLLFIFILSSCEKKDNIGRISSIDVENIKNEMEFEEGIKSYVYISETSRRVYYYLGLKDGFKVVIDDSFLSERILYEQKKDESLDEYYYNSSKLESPDKIYDYNNETKELSISIDDNKEILSNDIEYDKESILDYLSLENGDNLINPNFMVKDILEDMLKYSFINHKSTIKLFNTVMVDYYYHLKQDRMRLEGSSFFDKLKEKYLDEAEYDIFIKYIYNNVLIFGSPGYFNCYFQMNEDLSMMFPSFSMKYNGIINEYTGDGIVYFFNIDLLDKYKEVIE